MTFGAEMIRQGGIGPRPSIVNSATCHTQSTGCQVSFTAPAVGNQLICAFNMKQLGETVLTPPSGWSRLGGLSDAIRPTMEIWVKDSDGTEIAAQLIWGSSDWNSVMYLEIQNAHASGTVADDATIGAGHSQDNETATTTDGQTPVINEINNLILTFMGLERNQGFTLLDADWVQQEYLNDGDHGCSGVFYSVETPTVDPPADLTLTLEGAEKHKTLMVAIRPKH